jgi:hypothetical protein
VLFFQVEFLCAPSEDGMVRVVTGSAKQPGSFADGSVDDA